MKLSREDVETLREDLRIAGRFPTKADAERVLEDLLSAWEFAEIVRDCPPEALHLMPMAAQAVLSREGS